MLTGIIESCRGTTHEGEDNQKQGQHTRDGHHGYSGCLAVWLFGCRLWRADTGFDHVKAQADINTVGQETVTTAAGAATNSVSSRFGQCRDYGRACQKMVWAGWIVSTLPAPAQISLHALS